ncbi:MAG: DUF1800 domain-containing protein [Isosphaeraceae bacterium]|nr:DUF1800 domain-containing protein [Isosphaeraceae bacterium]
MSPPPLLSDPARAWSPFEPGASDPWDLPRVAHLHRRAGFAAPWTTLERDLRDGPAASITRLLDGEAQTPDGKPAAAFEALLDDMGRQLAPAAVLPRLQGIWLYRMIFTAHPLRERMTLFWHNHFATSNAKVQNPALMQRQNDLFRTHALGDFEALVAAVGKDPAMLIWLDSTANRKARPNENYAREVMELFTLGRGRYSEQDIQEAARAFTGWFVVRDRFQEIVAQHDDGPKTILGRTGRFDGDDVPPLLLDQPACAEFLCGKLIRYFITEVDPVTPELIAPLARRFRESRYNVRSVVETILRSQLFHDPALRRRRVKCPVEHTIGTIRALEVFRPTVQADTLAEACGRMGQNLYAPPSVAGWEWGAAWANSTTMLARTNFVLSLLADKERASVPALKQGAKFLVDLLVQDGFDPRVRQRIEQASAKEMPALVLTSPEYQLA